MGKATNRSALFLDRAYIDQKFVELRSDIMATLDAKFRMVQDRENKIISMLGGAQTQEKRAVKAPVEKQPSVSDEINWKVEMRRRVYADFNTVLRRVYGKMRDVYGFVSEQAIKEYRNAHPGIERASCLDAVSDSPQWRSIFDPVLSNLEEDSRKEMERRRMAAEAEMGKTRQEIIQPLIEARGDKSNYGCATYTLVKGRLKKKGILYANYEEGYRRDTGIKRHISNGELIDNVPALKREFAKAVGELLAEQKVVKNDGN